MIKVLNDSTIVGRKTLYVYAYVEVDDLAGEYSTTSEEMECVANKAMVAECFNDMKLYGIFGDTIKQAIQLYTDDCYEYPTIRDMLDNRDEECYKYWLDNHTTLEEHHTNVDGYNIYIKVFTNKW